MKVWVVRQDEWEETGPLSVWTTRELAEAEVERLKASDGEFARFAIEEFTLDQP